MRTNATPGMTTPTVGAFEAKTHLSRLLEEVKGGSILTITVRGKAVAKLVPADAEVRLPGRPGLESWLTRAAEVRSRGGPGADPVAVLVRAGRRP
jgi:prevent-host-death family protein